MKNNAIQIVTLTLISTFFPQLSTVLGQGTAFTYQGRFTQGGASFSGSAEMQFTLWSAESGGTQLAAMVPPVQVVGVSNGLFTTSINFTSLPFTGADRWLQIEARTTLGAFTLLTPRQKITPAPYAMHAGTVNASGITGTILDSQLSANIARLNAPAVFTGPVSFNNATGNFSGAFTGSGAGMTNIDLTLNSRGAISAHGFMLDSSPAVGSVPLSVIATDVNGDNKLDLVAANFGNGLGQTVTVLLNDGVGGFVFSSSPQVGAGPFSVAAADVNGDGSMDLVTANQGATFGANLGVMINNGAGGFVRSFLSPVVGDQPRSVVAADINQDGKVDAICASLSANTLTVLTNNGSGGFVSSSTVVGTGAYSVVAVDVNGDGRVDLISANASAATLTVLTNNGSGGFALSSSPGVGSRPASVAAADLNGDGRVDLISANQDANSLTVLTNNGSGGFVIASSPSVGTTPMSVVAADVNGDAKVDLISANYGANTLSVLTNNGSGGFGLFSSPVVDAKPFSVAAADVNGDGRMDLISANIEANTLSILFNGPTFNGAFSGNGAGLTRLNAANLSGSVPSSSLTSVPADSLTGTIDDARLSGSVARLNANQTFTGNNTIAPPASLSFGSGTRQMLNLYDTFYGIGVQSARLYFRAGPGATDGFAWFKSGTHSDTADDPGTGGTRLMTLDTNGLTVPSPGALSFGSQTRQILNLWGTQYGIGVQSSTVYFRTDNASGSGNGFAWYTGGVHNNSAQNPGVGGTTLMKLDGTGLTVNGVVVSASDRNLKENFAAVNAREVLNKIAALPICTWNYTNDPASRHIGPVAQDFHAAFGLGPDDKHIATVDADGVALAAIQGLNQKVEARSQKSEDRIQKLEAENLELKRELEALKRAMGSLANSMSGGTR